ncbi:hypothetical protein TRVL_06475 [Trypanosoma vivax]|uniref:Transmembrane protein n=1 Tax=Trypanosoma vivax (strain Y486) TaxID=1055687 RepID=G0U5D8_TRYVY|nr:hypothetical protein TRVL_06475 [Trypanosoma vivax]CCC51086.1 conserved hypothetical protein [Trypanosoma vivax Y486]
MCRRVTVRLAHLRMFSSAAFTEEGGSADFEAMKAQHTGVDPAASSSSAPNAGRPTVDTYRAMSLSDLETLLNTREEQVRKLRLVYENFHYEMDKRFRTMVFDYHEKALQLSQVHGKMQLGSLQISREALVKMREQQEMYSRDHRIVVAACTILTFIFWVWVKRHYVRREELFGAVQQQLEMAARGGTVSRSVTGAGCYDGNIFGSAKRNARNRETSWEREVRERGAAGSV